MGLLDSVARGARRFAGGVGERLVAAAAPKTLRLEVPTPPPMPRTAYASKWAPWPLIDRYPTVLGSQITLTTVASVMRLATTGYRQQWVDLQDELIERDGHAFSCVTQRIATVSGARLVITPTKVDDKDARGRRIAEENANFTRACFHGIRAMKKSIREILWGLYYGVSSSEVDWKMVGAELRPDALSFIHSRRLSYPDPGSLALHIWDQGMVRGWGDMGVAPTSTASSTGTVFGLRVDDHPGKFLVHTPQLRGDYPWRNGLGRQLAILMTLKGMALRGGSHYIERFGKPWPIAYAKTMAGPWDDAAVAEDEDKEKAQAALSALGVGSLTGAVLPDCIKVELFGPGHKQGTVAMSHVEFIELLNAEESKCVLTQTYTTEPGKHGARASADVGESSQMRIGIADAADLCEGPLGQLVYWCIRLNRPEEALAYLPHVALHVESEPTAKERAEVAAQMIDRGMQVDGDRLAEELDYKVVPNEPGPDGKARPRRMFPVKPVEIDNPELSDEETAAREQAKNDALAAKAATHAAGIKPGEPPAPAADEEKKPAAPAAA
jgi:phage gp29-like protein